MAKKKTWFSLIKRLFISEPRSRKEKKDKRRRWMYRILKMKELVPSSSRERLPWQLTEKNTNSLVTEDNPELQQISSNGQKVDKHKEIPESTESHSVATEALAAIKIQAAFRGYLVSSFEILWITILLSFIITSTLRVAVIGGGPAGSSAAEALASGGIETFIFERSPEAAKPCGGAIPLCMLDEFDIPSHLIDRKVTQMKIISPSNLEVDFGKTLKPHEFISMVRREVLDSFLRRRAADCGANLIKGLVTNIDLPITEKSPYIIQYISGNTRSSLAVDVIIGADGANSKVAKSIDAGNYTCAIAFQERIRLPEEKMKYYENLAEMYIGSDVSPDFYAWVFPKCDHVAVGTGTISSKQNIKQLQGAIRNRVRPKIEGGEIIKVEAHPIPEHPRPTRVRGRVALVGDAAGYVTKCSGEGIYFAAKSGRMCGEAIVRASENGRRMIGEGDLRREYLRKWDDEFFMTFKFLDVLQRVFYGSNAGLEALVELCGREYVQRMTFESYLYKKLAKGNPAEDAKMAAATVGSLIRCNIVGKEMVDFGRKLLKI